MDATERARICGRGCPETMSEAGVLGERLNEKLRAAGLAPVNETTAARLGDYVSLLLRWNTRMNLTAVREEDGILSLHIIESIIVARYIPAEINTLLDFGSGAGLPGIPIALCRPEIAVTLAESQGKKAAFLQEAARTLGLSVKIHAGRAEMLTEKFDCVTLRAVDRMAEAVAAAVKLVMPDGWLALLTTTGDCEGLKLAAGAGISCWNLIPLRTGSQRILLLGQLNSST